MQTGGKQLCRTRSGTAKRDVEIKMSAKEKKGKITDYSIICLLTYYFYNSAANISN